MPVFTRLINGLSNLLRAAGAIALTAMMLLTVADVVGRFFKTPIFGSVELVGYMAVAVMAAAMPYAYQMNSHVGVELVVRTLSRKKQLVLEIVTQTLSLFLFAVISWQMFVYAADLKANGEVSMNLEFPVHVVVYALAACLGVFSVTILHKIAQTLIQTKEEFQR